jgi:hypothetical protein
MRTEQWSAGAVRHGCPWGWVRCSVRKDRVSTVGLAFTRLAPAVLLPGREGPGVFLVKRLGHAVS